MRWLKPGDRVALTACSNGIKESGRGKIERLCGVLEGFGLEVSVSPCLYERDGRTEEPERRARVLTDYCLNGKIKGIFDVSGGDLAAELLNLLDYEEIKKHRKPFFGYSDLTVLLNGIYAKTGQSACLYQIQNLIRGDGERQRKAFWETFFEGKKNLYDCSWEFWQGDRMEGILAGGNIRCFLKLAGTEFFPKLDDKILFLEARSGEWPAISSMLHQLKVMNAFERVRGLLLGTFTELEAAGDMELKELILRARLPKDLPIAKTYEIGHGADSRAVWIGQSLNLTRL